MIKMVANKLKNKSNNKGFTLMELIIVVAIIAILIALIAPNLTGFLDTATSTSYEANAKSVYTAASAWVTQQRINGTVITGTVQVTSSGASFSGFTVSNKVKADLEEALDCGTFGNATCSIAFKSGKCTKVIWHAEGGDEASATYPKSATQL